MCVHAFACVRAFALVSAQERNLPLQLALLWAGHMLQAVHHMHQKGVVHQDIKSSNVLIFRFGVCARLCVSQPTLVCVVSVKPASLNARPSWQENLQYEVETERKYGMRMSLKALFGWQ